MFEHKSSCIAHDTLAGFGESEDNDLIWAKVILDIFEGDGFLDLIEALKVVEIMKSKIIIISVFAHKVK